MVFFIGMKIIYIFLNIIKIKIYFNFLFIKL